MIDAKTTQTSSTTVDEAQSGLQTLTITLPMPPSSLSPNGRTHWSVRARDTLRVRRDAFCLTRQAIWEAGDVGQPWPSARMDMCWRFAGRQPDDDNCWARAKACRDGIADALLVVDDRDIVTGAVTFERVKRSEQAVIITLTRLDAENDRIEGNN